MFKNYREEAFDTLDYYKRIFTTHYNMKFCPPKSFTCATRNKFEDRIYKVQNWRDLLDKESYKSTAREAEGLMNSFKSHNDPSVLAVCVDL